MIGSVPTLWAILSPRRRRGIVLVVLMAVVAAIVDGAVVVLVAPVIDALESSSAGAEDAIGPLVAFGSVLVVKNLLVVVISWYRNRELFAIQSDVSEQLLAIYLRGTNPESRGLEAGKRTSFAITEPLQLVLNCYLPLATLVAEGLALVAITAVLLVDRPAQTLVLGAAVAVGLRVFSLATRSRVVSSGRRRKDADTERAELVRSLIESRVEVAGLGVTDEVLSRYRRSNRTSAEMTARKSFLTETSRNVLELLLVAAVGPFVLAYLFADGEGLLAMLATFGMAVYRAMPALNRIMVATQSAKFGTGSLEAISTIFAAEPAAQGMHVAEDARPEHRGRGAAQVLDLRFQGFQLRNGRAVLDGCRVVVQPGQVCVVWGPSGSGKSTIVEALVDGADGLEIRYGGRLLAHGLSELRGQVGVTAQSPLVLPATLRENLTLGSPSDEVDTAAVAPLLDHDPRSVLDADSLTDRLDTPIHRHAVSGGQAQRISLLRALDQAHDIVVLDEPTSALDGRLAATLREQIASTRAGRIVVVVTHDPELKGLADVVVDVT